MARARKAARPEKRNTARGRDGETITRNVDYGDQFHIPEHFIEKGWSMQWCRESVYNKPDAAEMVRMQHAGWRPVNPDRVGYDSAVEGDSLRRDGLILMERPKSLTEEAQRENQEKATQQFMASMGQFDTANLTVGDQHKPMIRDIKRDSAVSIDSAMQTALSDVEIPAE